MPAPVPPATEWIVLAEVVDRALETGRRIVDPVLTEAGCDARGVSHEDWYRAVGVLKTCGAVALQTAPPSQVVLLAATNGGILAHLQARGYDLEGVRERLAKVLRSTEPNQVVSLAEEVGEPALLVECLLDNWVEQRLLVYSAAPRRRFRIHRVNL